MASHDELQTLCTSLSDYFDAVAAFVTLASNTCPSFEDFADTLIVDSILTEAVQNEKGSANYSSGAKVDIVHLIAAITREYAIRSRMKANYYADAPEEIGLSAESYRVMYGKYLNYFRGTSPEQMNN